MKMIKLFQSKLINLSLKARLMIVLFGLITAASSIALVFYLNEHKAAVREKVKIENAHVALSQGIQLREEIAELRYQVSNNNVSESNIQLCRALIHSLGRQASTAELSQLVDKISKSFESYLALVSRLSIDSSPDRMEVFAKYKELGQYLATYNSRNEELIYSVASQVKSFRENSFEQSLIVLFVFIVVTLVINLRLISSIFNPITKLIKFLDEFNVEEDLQNNLSKFNNNVPEVSRILKSVEGFLQRLRGYRNLSVNRLLNEKRRADIIAASISDGIFLLRGDEILYVNPIAEKILGLRPGTFLKGIKLSDELSLNGSSGMKSVERAVSRIIPVEFVMDLDERKYYYLIQSFPISYDLIEKVEHSVSVPGESHLVDRFQADTLVLAQDVTLVKEGQEAKSHFLATLSHEVKTPVTSLTMATRLLKKSVDQFQNPTHQSLISTCADDVDRLRSLLDDLLTVSRFDSLTQRLEIQRVDLGKLLVHSIQSFQPQARERGLELVHQIVNHGKPIVVAMDATKIAWALSNLMTNALRHSPRGGKVDVKLEVFDTWAEIRVRDNGQGIDRHRQERIFDKFSSYYDLRVARSGSIGAGLAIAREIVVAHGGKIWVVSEPGHGAEFCFTLPLKRSDSSILPEESVSKHIGRVTERLNEKNRFSI